MKGKLEMFFARTSCFGVMRNGGLWSQLESCLIFLLVRFHWAWPAALPGLFVIIRFYSLGYDY